MLHETCLAPGLDPPRPRIGRPPGDSRTPCRHCRVRVAGLRYRGLCLTCHADPDVREQYPSRRVQPRIRRRLELIRTTLAAPAVHPAVAERLREEERDLERR